MIKNYLKIAWRSLLRNKGLFSINIIGLSMGIATCLTITLYVADELSYDRFHKNSDRIARVYLNAKIGDELIKEAGVMAPVAKALVNEFPEVLDACRILGVSDRTAATHGNNTIRKGKMAFVDPNFLEVFGVPLIKGDIKTALSRPNSLILTQEQAESYFGTEDPLNKTVDLKDIGVYGSDGYIDNSGSYTVTGVISEIPANSHFHFDLLASMQSNKDAKNQSWLSGSYHTYLLLDKGADMALLEAKLPAIREKYMSSQMEAGLGMTFREFLDKGNRVGLYLQPLTKIHLHSDLAGEFEEGGSINTVYMFAAIALFMLLIACINFINLSTAGASKRMKEIGMRKVLGSEKRQLVFQFLIESFIVTLFAMGIGILIFLLTLPYFNRLSGKSFVFDQIMTPQFYVAVVVLTIIIGLLAGGYPAFYMSGFKPIRALKNTFTSQNSKGIRSGLVVFQFAVSACLIIGTLVVNRQMHYIQNKDIGYDREELIVIRDAGLLGDKLNAFKTELQKDPRVVSVTTSAFVPAGPTDNNRTTLSSDPDKLQKLRAKVYNIDEAYIPTLGMELLAGRNFSKDFGSEENNIIISEAAVRSFGLSINPVGQTLEEFTDLKGGKRILTVIGVVKDFHSRSLHEPIQPLMMKYNPYYGLIARVKTADMPDVIAGMENQWKALGAGEAFDYAFLDALYNETYIKEQNMNSVLNIFAFLTIFVACLGLFGLVTFATQQRYKEIGIRKVLGASVASVVALLSKDFIRLVLIAIVIATPIAWYAMYRWLQGFAYRIELQWWMFAGAGLLAVVIAMMTVSGQSVRAAMADPVNSLKSE